MIKINFIIVDLQNGKFVIKTMKPSEFFEWIKELDGSKADVAFDQSTSCTGFVIDLLGGNVMIVGEIVNENLHADFYVDGLLNIIREIISKLNSRYVIIEEPLKYVTHRQNPVLIRLKNAIIDLFELDGLTYEKFYKIAPQSWRAGLINKDNPYKKTSKEATAYEVLELFPMLEKFKPYVHNPTNNSGYDAFDAVGILIGFRNRFDVKEDSEIIMNIGSKNTTKRALTMFVYVSPDEITELQDMIKLSQLIINDQNNPPKIKKYNEECGVYLNAKMSLTDDLTVLAVTKDIDVISTLISFGLDYDPNKTLFMITVPLSKVDKKIPQALKNQGYNIDIFY